LRQQPEPSRRRASQAERGSGLEAGMKDADRALILNNMGPLVREEETDLPEGMPVRCLKIPIIRFKPQKVFIPLNKITIMPDLRDGEIFENGGITFVIRDPHCVGDGFSVEVHPFPKIE
jgi:hypothetical protein